MCGRYCALTEEEIIEVRRVIREVSLRFAKDEFDNYNETLSEIAPTNRSPVVTSDGDDLAFLNGQFGFEKWDGKGVIINARVETAKDKSMFKKHITRGRCVIPASGYYEWKAESDRKKKIKHLIKDKSGNLFYMAGLWREGKEGKEFVILTKKPVGQIAEIHVRMPVILRAGQLDEWLSGAMPIDELAKTEYQCFGEPLENNEYAQLSLL